MGLNEFLQKTGGSARPFPYAALAELSGISSEEASGLAEEWEEWSAERVRELLRRLGGLGEEDATLEFEAVFKAGLRLADAGARTLAVAGLAGSDDRTVIARVVEILRADEAEEARAAAAVTLSHLCSLASEGKLHRHDATRLQEALSGVLEDGHETTGVRRKALEAVAVFRGAAVDRFIEAAARDEESLMRQSALHAMGRTCDPRWLGHVMRAMDSPEAAIRYEATLALGEIAEAEHPEHSGHLRCLRETLDDTDLEVQLAAVTALERIGGEGARRLLREATGSPEPSVAGAAREALEGLAVEDALLDDVGGSLADGRTMYGGFLRPDREDEEGYDWRAREIVVEADEASLDEAYLEDPGAWPRNN